MSTPNNFPGPDPYAPLKDLPSFPLSSPDIADGEQIEEKFRAPQSVSPELNWSDLPEGTKSVAVTCFDPDAPTAAGFWHWAVFNIPASETGLAQGAGAADGSSLPAGAVQLKGDSGERGHYGANPPANHAPHRYMYAVHAVDVEELEVPEDATPTVLGFNLYFHSIARSIITPWWENTGE
ncbi:YbhB/YbcL family Raf kinase inhibitor-like protein [Corynebacterium sp. 335C]